MNKIPLILAAVTIAAPGWAQKQKPAPPKPATAPFPAVPTPGFVLFADRVAGRAAVSDSVYTLQAAPRLSVVSRWEVVTQDERKRVSTRTGTESLVLDESANRVSLVSTTNTGAAQTVTRFACDGYTLLVSRYVPPAPNAKPKAGEPVPTPRTFFRIAIEGETETVSDAMILAKAGDAPLTRVARTLLLAPLENGGYGWRSRGAFAQNGDNAVIETLPSNGNDKRRNAVVRRYRFDKSRRPVSVEEWTTNENLERKTARTTYRRESYSYPAYPTRTDVFTTKPAANYVETSPPSGASLPDPPGPDQADPKARAMLTRWTRAWARFTSLKATVAVTTQTLPTTPESRPIAPRDAQSEGTYTLYYERPAKLFLSAEPVAVVPKNNRADTRRLSFTGSQTAISDGETLTVLDGKKKRGDTPIGGEDARLRQAFRRNGFDDRAGVLDWIFDGPQTVFGDAETAEYRSDINAVTVRQTISQNTNNRRRRRRGNGGNAETVIITTIYFNDATGLPRRIERYISTTGAELLRRDDPPNRYFGADYSLSLNGESSPGIFKASP